MIKSRKILPLFANNADILNVANTTEGKVQNNIISSTVEVHIPHSINENNIVHDITGQDQSESEAVYVITNGAHSSQTTTPSLQPRPHKDTAWNENVFPRYAFTTLCGIILGIIVTSAVTLIPQHNVLEMSEFWFEFTLIY